MAEESWTRLKARGQDDVLEILAARLPGGFILQVGKNTESRAEVLESFKKVFIAVLIPLVVLAFVGGQLLAMRALRPVRGFIHKVRTITDTGNFQARMPVGQTDDELDELARIDNYATHKHEKVRRWLAARPRYHIHYTPTSASWLNQVEIWFNIITQRAIRRGTFRKVKELIARLEDFDSHYNADCRPFAWVATADSILQKVNRLCKYISGTPH